MGFRATGLPIRTFCRYNAPMWIDTHCHLTYPGLIERIPEVLANAQRLNVTQSLTIGTHPQDHEAVLTLLQQHPTLRAALGIHPCHAHEVEAGYLPRLRALLGARGPILAVGEIGLDYYHDVSTKPIQETMLRAQLDLAVELDLPVILHMREAHADGVAILRSYPQLRYVVHCFTAGPAECQAWLDLGAYIGFTGVVTYKNANLVRDSARLVPRDRILVETDAPYLSPEPVRRIKINEPGHTAYVGKYLVQWLNWPETDLAQATTANALRLFGPGLWP